MRFKNDIPSAEMFSYTKSGPRKGDKLGIRKTKPKKAEGYIALQRSDIDQNSHAIY